MSGSGDARDAMSNSLFRKARMSFFGQRGASLATLRGSHGAIFENEGKIIRGVDAVKVGCWCLGGGGEGDVDRLVLIKGPFCFVFDHKDSDSSPMFAIGLHNMKAEIQSPAASSSSSAKVRPGTAVVLRSTENTTEYEFLFPTQGIAEKFVRVVRLHAGLTAGESLPARLKREIPLQKRSSVRVAENIAARSEE